MIWVEKPEVLMDTRTLGIVGDPRYVGFSAGIIYTDGKVECNDLDEFLYYKDKDTEFMFGGYKVYVKGYEFMLDTVQQRERYFINLGVIEDIYSRTAKEFS